jgi:Pro-kumamolisin, activation domain/Bacterial Ig-like domain (group 3)/MBG domain (YGX type)/FG-GAP-like repeat
VRVTHFVVGLLAFAGLSGHGLRRGLDFFVRFAVFALVIFIVGSPALNAQEAQLQTMHSRHVRPEVSDRRAAFVGRLADDTQMHLSVILPLRNQDALNGLLQRLYDPSSPGYRHFLSAAQFTEQFGPAEDDYRTVAAYLQSYGLKVEAAPSNRLIVPVSGSAAQVNAAFNVQMSNYEHPTEHRQFFSPDREPSLRLSMPIRHIAGLDNFSEPHHFVHRAADVQATPRVINGSGPGSSYLGSDMRAVYYGGTTLDGTGQTVGLLEFGGYDMTDVTLTFSGAGQSTNVPVNNVLLDGATGSTTAPYGDAEQVLDIVQAIGMAPGLSQVRVYIGIGQDDAAILNSMASENTAQQFSCSWGWLPVDPGSDDVFFQEMAAQGQSFFTASGDNGAFDTAINPYSYPADDQYVTTVGGTHLTTTDPGGSWVSEIVWNSGGGGSGGGISPNNIPLPSYQNGIANSANGGSTTLRNVPDVAMEADFDNYACASHVCNGDYAGTSFAAPRWAGFMALVNQQAVEGGAVTSGGIGFLNPPLYQLAQGTDGSNDLHDIVSGNDRTENQPVWFSATSGYDLTTGWGSANGQSLINDLAGPPAPGFWLTSSQSTVQVPLGGTGTATIRVNRAGGFTDNVNLAVTSTLPAGVTASFASNPATADDILTFTTDSSTVQQNVPVTVTGTSSSLTRTVNLTLSAHAPTFALVPSSSGFTLNPSGTVTATITVTPEYGFTGSVALAIAGLPTGVTASFSPTSTTGASTLTLTASSSVAGNNTYPLTITGTSGSITSSTTISLAVIGPSFALYSEGPVTVGQGSTSSTYITMQSLNGFSSSVTLAASNLPAGVTATFGTNPTTQTSLVTFTASSTTPTGQTAVTITGTSGTLTASATIQLNVMAPSFALSTSTSATVGQGGSTTAYVNISPQYGFTGNVQLSLSGLPSGVTALWTSNPTPSGGTLYLYATNATAPGTYPLTVTGTSGVLTNTATLSLTVAAPTYTLSTSGSITMGASTTANGWVDVNRQYGFAGSVSLLASGMPSGVTVSFGSSPLSGTAYNSSMTVTASASVAPGQYPITITGVSGSQTITTTLTLSINVPAFTLFSPSTMTVGQGTSVTSYVDINDLYGFSSPVTLSVSGLPSGVTATFSPNPTTYSTQLTFTASSSIAAGQYPITITGTSGSLTQTVTMTLTVAPVSFTLSSYALTIGQGQTGATSVYLNAVNGFNNPVTLSISGLPSGVTAAFATNPTTAYATQLSFTAGSSVAAGQYPLTITGTSGSLTQTTTLTLTVGVPSFTLYAASSPTIGLGSTGTGYVYLETQNGFAGSVALSISGLPSGVTAVISTNPTTYSSAIQFTVASNAVAGSSTVTITGTYGSQVQTTTMPLTVAAPGFSLYGIYGVSVNQGTSATSTLTVSPQYGFTGNVSLSTTGLPGGVTASFSPNPTTGSATMTLSAASTAAPGSTSFTITGTSGSITNSITTQVSVNQGSFSLAMAPNKITLVPGGSGKSTIDIVPVNSFASPVVLTASGLPSGVTASISPATITGSSTLTLTADSTAQAGSSTLTITGSSGALTNSALLQLTVTNSTVAAAATTLTFTAGGNAVSSVAQGTLVTAMATVTAGANPVAAGQVYLCDAGASYCDSAHQIAAVQLNNNGNAVFRFIPGPGTHAYKALFAGTTTNLASSSSSTPLTVTGSQPTATTITQTGTAGNYTVAATVTGQGPAAPTGNVSFVDTTANNAVLASAPAVANASQFTEKVGQTIAVGANPAFTASGDFNGDGIPDLAVSNVSSTTVSILLGSSGGTFQAGTALQIGSAPGPVVIGDFNRDGIPDIAVGVASSSTIAIYLGNGDGTFNASAATLFTLPQPVGLIAGDMNGDGFQDLTALSQNGNVSVFLGHGDGTFTASPFSFAVASYPRSMVQADFNGDGIPDLAFNNEDYPGGVTILLGNGDASFTAAPTVSPAVMQYAMTVGDFNHDGKPDLALGTNGGLAVYLGNGDGTFAQPVNILSSGYIFSLAAADMNNDGNEDLIATDVNASKALTLLGNGDGTFSTGPSISNLSQPEGLIVGDWNSDGIPDIGVANYYSNSMTIILSQMMQTSVAVASGVTPYGSNQHLVEANYPGDSIYAASASGTVSEVGSKITPTVAIALSPSTVTPLTVSVQVTDTITHGVPGGTIQLTSGGYSTNSITLVSGSGSFTIPAGGLAAGVDTLTVSYSPDSATGNLYNASSGTATVTITQAAPSITWPTPAAITYGTALSAAQLNATSSVAGTFSYSPAAATVLPAGQQTLSVTFTPTDATDYQGQTSSILLNVNKAPLSIAANNASRAYGTGNPAFAGNILGAVNGDSFTETFTTSATGTSPAGNYAIVPAVSGTSLADYAVTVANGTLTISPATVSMSWIPPTPITYGTALSAAQLNATSSVAGTFSYSPAAGAVLPAGQQTLSVTFIPTDATDYQSQTSSILLNVNKAPLSIAANNASRAYGAANPSFTGSVLGAVNGDSFTETFTTSATGTSPAGNYAIVPSVGGTNLANYAVTAINGTLVVSASSSTITWPAPAAITYGTALSAAQLNATSSVAGTFSYSPAAATILHAGQQTLSVTFTPTDSTNYQSQTSSILLNVNKAPLSIAASNASRVYETANPTFTGSLNGTVNGDTFVESFSTSATTSSQAGAYAVVPTVSGTDLADYAVTATNGTLTISPASTTTVFALQNQNLTFTATVSATSAGVPSGQVIFYAGQTQLGTATLNGGMASITLTSFPSGNPSLSAQYGGDVDFSSSSSTAVPVLTFVAANPSLTVPTSGTATDSFNLVVPSGYAGTVQLSCTGLPSNATCNFQPASIAFSGTTASSSTVMTLSTSTVARMDSTPLGNMRGNAIRLAAFVLPGLLPLMATKRRRWIALLRTLPALLLLCGAGLWLMGCGGGSKPITPSGNYTIQVTASGTSGVSASTAVTVIVQ